MSAKENLKLETVARPPARRAGPGSPGGAIAAEKPKALGTTARRIWQAFGNNRTTLVVALLLSVGSVIGSSIGPWQLGKATDLLVGDDFSLSALVNQLLIVAAIYLGRLRPQLCAGLADQRSGAEHGAQSARGGTSQAGPCAAEVF